MKFLLRVLDSTGDSRREFETDQPESLADAERVFAELKAKGHSIFNVVPGSNECARRITKPTEAVTEVISVPCIVAG